VKQPSSQALEHSMMLCQKISELITSSGGKITFAEFMQQALYAPVLGYYNSGTTKFGAAGDFITAPELGSMFANCVAIQCKQILRATASSTILEIGAGSGQFACDLLIALNKTEINLKQYLILELSADLRLRQQQLIKKLCPQFVDRVQWLDQLPGTAINGVIIANEVIDAMPVARFCFAANKLQEYYVVTDNNKFAWLLENPSKQLEKSFADQNISLYLEQAEQPYVSELNLWQAAWIKSLSQSLDSGAILLFDYGFPRAEYYHPQRITGTLMCHYQHHCHADPFYYPGLQDITAHVDFTSIAENAVANNLELGGYANLASFLINCGITSLIANPVTQRQAQELNILSSPAEMGELFKVMGLTKNLNDQLIGFKDFDKRHSLGNTNHKP